MSFDAHIAAVLKVDESVSRIDLAKLMQEYLGAAFQMSTDNISNHIDNCLKECSDLEAKNSQVGVMLTTKNKINLKKLKKIRDLYGQLYKGPSPAEVLASYRKELDVKQVKLAACFQFPFVGNGDSECPSMMFDKAGYDMKYVHDDLDEINDMLQKQEVDQFDVASELKRDDYLVKLEDSILDLQKKINSLVPPNTDATAPLITVPELPIYATRRQRQ